MSRYERQIRCGAFGQKGQQLMEQATFLVIGAGALGSAVSEQLTRAGAGRLVICDMDIVEVSNLHRQSCYTEADAADHLLKVIALKNHLQNINGDSEIFTHTEEVTSLNIEALIRRYTPTIVIDGTDAFSTRFLINEACHKHQIPWVYGACLGTKGTVLGIDHSGPCLKCLLLEDQSTGQDCSIAGILPPAAHLSASMQVAEIMNYMATGQFSQQLITFDTQTMRFQQTKADRLKNPACETCGQDRYHLLQRQLENVVKLCGGKYMIRLNAERFTSTKLNFQKSSLHFKYYQDKQYQISFFHDGRVIISGAANQQQAEHIVNQML
ncbi:ThiF family adenylyltransferase [Macrococcus carouselicus]|uniref:ThiF family adenylyltransferase n=1 Tax=Macrococcus carouselicus TaxID=69969 RepID=UPI0014075245|nr:ThiF family adenylyltransferase [Macrococcus carouselicus]